MAADLDAWSVDANEAVTVSIAEQIFGYQNLRIDLRFAAHDLRPHVDISYGRKFKPVGDTAALDLMATLKNYLPPLAFERGFDGAVLNDSRASDWTPPGERVHVYERGGHVFETWAAPLSDPAMKALVDNIQILVLFFIEGAVFINLDDVDWTLDRWRVYLVYKKDKAPPTPTASPYSFVGYATTYRFYKFAKSLPSRLRISQFLILPKYQRGGHGSALYQTIQRQVLADATIAELTVEDPSEEFDKLRDVNDFKLLRPAFERADIRFDGAALDALSRVERSRIGTVPTAKLLPLATLRQLRTDLKIAPRQFARQTEMFLLSKIKFSHRQSGGANMATLRVKGPRAANPDDRAYYWWRALLKQRILRKNKDQLTQLPMDERIAHIEDTARGQEDEYEGMLLIYALQDAKAEEHRAEAAAAPSTTARKRKQPAHPLLTLAQPTLNGGHLVGGQHLLLAQPAHHAPTHLHVGPVHRHHLDDPHDVAPQEIHVRLVPALFDVDVGVLVQKRFEDARVQVLVHVAVLEYDENFIRTSNGSAIVAGLLTLAAVVNKRPTTADSLLHAPTNFIACVRSAKTAQGIQKSVANFDKYKVTTLQNENVEGVKRADVIILGCKPYMISGILSAEGMREALAGKLLISICAGVTAEQIEEILLPDGGDVAANPPCRVVRAMPNTAAVLRESMTVIADPTPPLSAKHSSMVDWIFSQIGRVVHLPPANMDVCTALCGASPAFLALCLDGLADGALAMGLPRAEAQLMAAQTMRGAAALALAGEHPAIIRDKISTPGGCTIGGLLVLEEAAVRGSIARAIREATEIATEIGKGRTGVNGTRVARR
ncbi:hypothetical protein DV737_g5608, partial [Chaetothyriales sp. CBS 132003]